MTLLAIVFCFSACGGKPAATGGAEATSTPAPAEADSAPQRSDLVACVDLPGWPGSTPRQLGGFENIGDADRDGRDDVILYIAGSYPGTLIAFSGADGKELYRITGATSKDADAPTGTFTIKSCKVTGDFDGDGLRDLHVPNAWTSRGGFLYFSAADGSFLHRQKKAISISTVARLRDHDGDGEKDFVYLYSNKIRVYSPTAKDPIDEKTFDDITKHNWRITDLPDFDGDGEPDLLSARYEKKQTFIEIHSGATFKPIKTFEAGEPTSFGQLYAVTIGDVDADGKADVALQCDQGAPSNRSVSYIKAVSCGQGKPLWLVDGSFYERTREIEYTAVKPGQRLQDGTKETRRDVKFLRDMGVIADADGDGAPELVTAGTEALNRQDKPAGALFVLSGRTGKLIAAIEPPKKLKSITGPFVVLRGPKGKREYVAVAGRNEKNKPALAIIDLAKTLK